jgi:hypothetical protein
VKNKARKIYRKVFMAKLPFHLSTPMTWDEADDVESCIVSRIAQYSVVKRSDASSVHHGIFEYEACMRILGDDTDGSGTVHIQSIPVLIAGREFFNDKNSVRQTQDSFENIRMKNLSPDIQRIDIDEFSREFNEASREGLRVNKNALLLSVWVTTKRKILAHAELFIDYTSNGEATNITLTAFRFEEESVAKRLLDSFTMTLLRSLSREKQSPVMALHTDVDALPIVYMCSGSATVDLLRPVYFVHLKFDESAKMYMFKNDHPCPALRIGYGDETPFIQTSRIDVYVESGSTKELKAVHIPTLVRQIWKLDQCRMAKVVW